MADSTINIIISAVTESATKAIQSVSTAMKNINKSMQESGNSMKAFGSTMKDVGNNLYSIGAKATMAISAPLAGLSKSMIDAGSSLKAMNNTYTTVFENMSDEARNWSKELSKSVGLSAGIIDETQLNFRKMGGAFGLTGKDAMDFSQKWTKLTLDLAAFNDIPIAEATERMQSGLRGEADAVEKLGIFMGEANIKAQMMSMGLKGNYSDLTMVQKQQVLYALAMKQTSQAQGQASREASSYQNAMANLNQTYKELSLIVFTAVEPALLGFLEKIKGIMESLKSLSPAQVELLTKLALFLIVVPPIIMYIGMFVESLGRLFEVIGTLKIMIAEGIGFTAFGAILLGVIAVSILVFTYWDQICNTAIWLKSVIMDLANNAVAWLTNEFEYLKNKSLELKDYLIKLKDEAIQSVKDAWQTFIQYLSDNKQTIEDVAWVIGVVFAPALIKTGVEAVIAGGKIAVEFITSVITAGTEAVISAGKIVGSFIASMITAGKEAIVNGAKITAEFIASLISAGKEAVITAGKIAVTLVQSLVAYAVQGWTTVGAIVAQTVAWIAQKVAVMASAVANYALEVSIWLVNVAEVALTAVTWALSTAIAFLTSPIGLVVIAIVALIAIGVALYKNWDTVKAKASEVWGSISDWVGNKIDYLKGRIDAFKSAFANMFSGVKLPSFSFSGSLNPLKWETEGIPKIGISWHQAGGIFENPSIIGVGENGSEAVVPISNPSKIRPFAQAVAEQFMSMLPDNNTNLAGAGAGNVVITGNSFVIREEADINKVAEQLYKLQERSRRGRGGSQ